jgi:hypothetical protein
MFVCFNKNATESKQMFVRGEFTQTHFTVYKNACAFDNHPKEYGVVTIESSPKTAGSEEDNTALHCRPRRIC